jgi:uncharacterized protein
MLFELSRRFARLPRWLRLCFQVLAAASGTAFVLVVFSVVGQGPDAVHPFAGNWAWVSLGLFAVLAIGTAILGNAAYERFRAWELERLPTVREFFHNHDLARLVGQSIGMTLRACEADLPDGDARVVHRLALRAERDWPAIAQGDRARQWLARIQDDRLLALIRDPTHPALSDEQTAVLLDLLYSNDQEQVLAFADPANGTLVRERLGRRLGEALRQALKRDFARRGEGAFGLLLDIAGELLNQGAATLARTTENRAVIEQAVRITLSLDLPVPSTQAVALHAQIHAQADRLHATYRAVRAEGRASLQRDRVTHQRLVLIAVLLLAVGLSMWHEQHRTQTSVEASQQATEQRLTAIVAQLREALARKQVGDDPTQRQLTPKLLAKARELLERGDPEQRAVAKMALKYHTESGRLTQGLKREPPTATSRLPTPKGDNSENAAKLDRTMPRSDPAPDEQVEERAARNSAAIGQGRTDIGEMAGYAQAITERLTGTLILAASGYPDRTIAPTGAAVGMATGWRNGTYFQFGGDMAEVATKAGLAIDVMESQGSLDNIERIRSAENAAFGIVQSDVLGYLERDTESNRDLARRLRVILPLYLEKVYILARGEIRSLRDLDGQRVAIGEPGGKTWITANNLLRIAGVLPGQKVELPTDFAEAYLLRGDLDAMVYVTGKPAVAFAYLNRMAEATDDPQARDQVAQLHFVPVSPATDPEVFAEYEQSTIGPQDYPRLEAEVPVAAVRSMLIGFDYSSLENRYYQQRCQQFRVLEQAVRENLAKLRSSAYHPRWKEVNLDRTVPVPGWRFDDCSGTAPRALHRRGQ